MLKRKGSYRHKGSYNINKKQKMMYVACIVLAIVSIVLVILYGVSNKGEYSKIKVDKDKAIVYTQYTKTKDKKTTEVPYINISSTAVEVVNKQIKQFSSYYLNADDKNIISYKYDINGDILSVLIQVNYYNKISPFITFKTYNVNLETLNVLTDEEMLQLYNIEESTVENKLKEKFEYFFKDEREKKIFDEECDYQCFLEMRGIENYTDNIHYYINKGKLYVYKEFNIHSIYDEEDYYKFSDFKTKISE